MDLWMDAPIPSINQQQQQHLSSAWLNDLFNRQQYLFHLWMSVCVYTFKCEYMIALQFHYKHGTLLLLLILACACLIIYLIFCFFFFLSVFQIERINYKPATIIDSIARWRVRNQNEKYEHTAPLIHMPIIVIFSSASFSKHKIMAIINIKSESYSLENHLFWIVCNALIFNEWKK